MRRPKRTRTPLGALLATVLGALALVAMPGLAAGNDGRDGNHDRLPDRWEKRHHLSLDVNQAHRDQDRDHLRNLAEFRAGDDPRDHDSDDDGVFDGEENAGTIASFDAQTGRLTIDLFGDDTVNGLVTDRTKIKCEDEHSPDISARDDHGEDEPGDDHGGEHGDNSGPGSENSGPSGHDDNGTGANCTASNLIVGAIVQEAELEIEHGTATFEEVELAD